ncbi:unnamed protein product [Moneuplotes crassus]|uniref:Uncharacterized protein n=1 Tax=Euplotes crassus TaxID=5936 RepID=A0AAD1U5T5_EUPCR|nr:unnamed protein product [Moneuplotes crassus]
MVKLIPSAESESEFVYKKFIIKDSCYIDLENELLHKSPIINHKEDGFDPLSCIVYKGGKYWIYHGKDFQEDEIIDTKKPSVWLVLNDVNKYSLKDLIDPKYGYRIKQGDILRFGKVRFKVKQISSKDELDHSFKENCTKAKSKILRKKSFTHSYESMKFFETSSQIIDSLETSAAMKRSNSSVHKRDSKAKICRVCLDEDEIRNEENPLIAPCSCSGSVQYIHLNCLKQWNRSNRKTREAEYVNSYHWEKQECGICKDLFGLEFQQGDKLHKILDYKEPTTQNFMVLESFSKNNSKTLHVIEIPNEQAAMKNKIVDLFVGRVSRLNIRITDASVSRIHSRILFCDGEFYLMDLNSKFGTLVRQKYPLPIPYKRGYTLALQIIEAYMEISPEFPCCPCFKPKRNNAKVSPDTQGVRHFKTIAEHIPANFRKYFELLDDFIADKEEDSHAKDSLRKGENNVIEERFDEDSSEFESELNRSISDNSVVPMQNGTAAHRREQSQKLVHPESQLVSPYHNENEEEKGFPHRNSRNLMHRRIASNMESNVSIGGTSSDKYGSSVFTTQHRSHMDIHRFNKTKEEAKEKPKELDSSLGRDLSLGSIPQNPMVSNISVEEDS